MARYVSVLIAVALFSQSDLLMDRSIGCAFPEDQTGCKPCLRPGSEPEKPIYNKFADVTNIDLDKSELRLKKREEPDKPTAYYDLRTIVTVSAEDPEQDVLTYNYTVSGGRIVGTGAKVTWDLSGVQAGTYTITAGVDDGCGICGKTMTTSVTITEDATAAIKCVCPEISISKRQPDESPGNIDVFTAQLNGKVSKEITYNWTISAGMIVTGQGTPTLTVRVPEGHSSDSGTVTVEIGGLDPACACKTTSSRSY